MRITITDGLAETRNHWRWGRGWEPGRRKYYVHLTTERAPLIRSIAGDVQSAIGNIESVDVIPPDLLHLTMTAIGFTDEVTDRRVAEVSAQVFDAWQQISSPIVEFDRLLLADEALMLIASDSDWLMEFSDLQRRIVDEVLGPQPWRPFRPHLSLSYSSGNTPIAPILTRLAPVADTIGDTVSDTFTLTLMSLGKDRRRYEWETIRRDPG